MVKKLNVDDHDRGNPQPQQDQLLSVQYGGETMYKQSFAPDGANDQNENVKIKSSFRDEKANTNLSFH